MKDVDARVFAGLFRDAYQKCFSHDLSAPLTESESHHFSNEILEKTGLVIGWKSLKNYSHFVLSTPGHTPQNPSISTLDTLARYVADAPPTDEVRRKQDERHFPYWFQYKEAFLASNHPEGLDEPVSAGEPRRPRKWAGYAAAGVALLVLVSIALPFRRNSGETTFTDEFDAVTEDALAEKGWFVQSKTEDYWDRRGEKPGHLTLFTLSGDNWPDAHHEEEIKNLLLRSIPSDCFIAELHLSDFFPTQNWQQAGLLLLEDTTFTGKSLRLSIGYNDFSGGFTGPREVIVQAVTSLGREFSKPEEIAHHQLFALEPETDSLTRANLAYSALRIERRSDGFRLLYSNGPLPNTAFKEVARTAFSMRPAYVGLFALRGWVDHAEAMPVYIDAFNLTGYPCKDS